MSTYRSETGVIDTENPAHRALLVQLHEKHARLLCDYVSPALEMYLARTVAGVLIKRMPGTGSSHAPGCPSYEPPAELSGAAGLAGSAIVENPDTGMTMLRLGFTMTRRGSQPVPGPGTGPSDTAKADTRKLSLRGLLHYLWEEARFNHWTPRWTGKRNWRVIHSHLTAIAGTKTTATEPLRNTLFIPEPFQAEQKEEIVRRRRAALARLVPQTPGQRNLMIVIGEVKEIAPSRAAFRIVFKHLPDFPFGLSADLHSRLQRKFATDIGLWDKEPANHLIAAATFSMTPAGYATVEELTAMATNANWVPIDNGDDEALVRALTDTGRAFFKVLRYGLPPSRPTAAAILTDARPKPVALYIVPGDAGEDYRTALSDLAGVSDYPAWYWQPGRETTLRLPPVDGFAGMAFPQDVAATEDA